MTTWTMVSFTAAKPHIAPLRLTVPIIDDLDIRGGGQSRVDALRSGALYIDHGGPMSAQRKYIFADVDGLKLAVPAAELAQFLRELKLAELRLTNDIPYFKLHGYVHAIVLTPAQRDSLMASWEASMWEVRADALANKLRLEAIVGNPGDVELSYKDLN